MYCIVLSIFVFFGEVPVSWPRFRPALTTTQAVLAGSLFVFGCHPRFFCVLGMAVERTPPKTIWDTKATHL